MINNLYILSNSYYSDYSPLYFKGPDDCHHEFESLCDSLMDQACLNALKKQNKEQYPDCIGNLEIIDELIPLLEKEGYYNFIPNEKNYHIQNIIINECSDLPKKSVELIIDYNNNLLKSKW